MARIGFDMDGVIYQFDQDFRSYALHAQYITPEQAEMVPTDWHFYRKWGWTDEKFLGVMYEGVVEDWLFSRGTAYPGAVQAIHDLATEGHSIHIITHRMSGYPGDVWESTGWWLAKHGIPFDGVYFTADKAAANMDFYVDDLPSNVEATLAAGVPSWVMDRPWNQDATHLPRVANLMEFKDEIVRATS